jgi:hypothetical protein
METTEYKMEKMNNRYRVTHLGFIVADGFIEQDMALHGIWVINVSVPTDFYKVDEDGTIYLERKNENS